MSDENPEPDPMQQDLLDAIAGGRKIEAIKIYRKMTGCDLKDAKEKVEEMSAELSEQHPDVFPQQKTGCASMLAIVIAAVLSYLVF
ncbi:MAG: ribosomal protein L7/L12 [Planctomycetota bacterium]|nr:ribosomal protein L7/L12 [Planctomycetota bacterium]